MKSVLAKIAVAIGLMHPAAKHSVVLTWQGATTTYQVWRQHGNNCPGGTGSGKYNLRASVTVLTWTDTENLAAGQTYCYYVTDAAGQSNTVTVGIPD